MYGRKTALTLAHRIV